MRRALLPADNETESWVAWQLLLDLADALAVDNTAADGIAASADTEDRQYRPPQGADDGKQTKKKENTGISSTLSYDLVNVGRECLAKLSNQLFWKLENSASLPDVTYAAASMVALQRDADRLLCADDSFSLGRWLLEARAWGKTDDESNYFEWQARAQPTTWLPACPTRPTSNRTADTCGSRSDLADCEHPRVKNRTASGCACVFVGGAVLLPCQFDACVLARCCSPDCCR